VVATSVGAVYSCVGNTYGQLGIGTSVARIEARKNGTLVANNQYKFRPVRTMQAW
jgi:hypothetical protein